MRFFIEFLLLLFLFYSTEKTERKPLSLCKTSIDSLLHYLVTHHFHFGRDREESVGREELCTIGLTDEYKDGYITENKIRDEQGDNTRIAYWSND